MTERPILNPQHLPHENRGEQNKIESHDAPPLSISLMQIDEAVILHLIDNIKPTVARNERVLPVPVMYGSPERWKTIQRDGDSRDPDSKKFQPPAIFIQRSKIEQGPNNNPNNKHIHFLMESRWNQRNIYDRFAVQNYVQPSKAVYQVTVPDYLTITYDGIVWTEFAEDMNHVLEQINSENFEFWGKENNFRFRAKIDAYTMDNKLPADEDRQIRSNFSIQVNGYIIPERVANRHGAPSSTTIKSYTSKKLVSFVEVEKK